VLDITNSPDKITVYNLVQPL